MERAADDDRKKGAAPTSFYHLTRTKALNGFVATTDPRGRKGKYHVPLECKVHGPEAPDARLCVAPTVWQCLISMTDSRTLYIYKLGCIGAFAPLPEHKVLDAEITSEHWITDAVIEQNGGLIPVTRVGILKGDLLWTMRDRINRWQLTMGTAAKSVDERSALWVIDESQIPNNWRLRDGIGELDEEEIDDPSPLGLPEWGWSKPFD